MGAGMVQPGIGVALEASVAIQRRTGGAALGCRSRKNAACGSALADRVGQRYQVVFIRMGGLRAEGPGVSYEIPPPRCGDASGMADAQIPGMGFPRGGERAYDCRRVRVDERQRRHRIMRTPRPAAATGNIHDRKAIVRKRCASAGHAHPFGPRCSTVTIGR
jgi:hypothetical protein